MSGICAQLGGYGISPSSSSSSSSVQLLLFLLAGFLGSVAEAHSTSFSPSGASAAVLYFFLLIISSVLMAIFILMGIRFIYLRQNYEEEDDSLARIMSILTRENSAGGTRWMRSPRGLHSPLIGTFPKLLHADVKDHKLGKGALECAVCLEEFDDDDSLRLFPKCDHVFHAECIDVWLAYRTTCPVCRADLHSNSYDRQPVAVASPRPDAAAPPASSAGSRRRNRRRTAAEESEAAALAPQPRSDAAAAGAHPAGRHEREPPPFDELRRLPQQEEGSSRGGRSSKFKLKLWSPFSMTEARYRSRRRVDKERVFFSPRRDVCAGEGGSTRRRAEMAGDGRSVESKQDRSSVRNPTS